MFLTFLSGRLRGSGSAPVIVMARLASPQMRRMLPDTALASAEYSV